MSVNPRMVFENPTVEQLAAAVDALGDSALDDVVAASEARFEPMSTSGLSETDLAAVTQLWSRSRGSTP
jgi:mycobactin peptide synthetase MbtE